ncbi:MAG: hypothetical protein PHX18_00175 [Candidatus Gastranaerophilales bacterium]|nr:hypothetical protein [Candidatus Gastranaerophilales bacterium]
MTIYFDENKKAYGDKIPNHITSVADEVWDVFCTQPAGITWDIIDGEFVDLRQSPEYLKQKRLQEVEQELITLDREYIIKLDTPVTYTNGFAYKPKYAQDTYISLLSAGQMIPDMFPMKIWDSSELQERAVEMSLSELTNLTIFLAGVQQGYFNERKQAKAILQKEKEGLNV